MNHGKPVLCPQCKEEAVLGMHGHLPVWKCRPCKRMAGVHQSSIRNNEYVPISLLLDAEGEKARKRAQREFKRVWMAFYGNGLTKNAARDHAYAWLHSHMGRKLHIAESDTADLVAIAEACKGYGKTPLSRASHGSAI